MKTKIPNKRYSFWKVKPLVEEEIPTWPPWRRKNYYFLLCPTEEQLFPAMPYTSLVSCQLPPVVKPFFYPRGECKLQCRAAVWCRKKKNLRLNWEFSRICQKPPLLDQNMTASVRWTRYSSIITAKPSPSISQHVFFLQIISRKTKKKKKFYYCKHWNDPKWNPKNQGFQRGEKSFISFHP